MRALPFALIIFGVITLLGAKQISRLKSTAWRTFYRNHPKAAAMNPLSGYAGTELSIAVGARYWSWIGILSLAGGLLILTGKKTSFS